MSDDGYASVLARFRGVRPAGRPGTWKALCPAHDDRGPSLGLWIGENGALLVGCWAGCPKDAVLAAAGVEMRELFPDAGERPARRARAGGGRRPVEVYPYRDEGGRLLYEVLRWEPKHFTQRTPGGGHGIGDVRRVLYRLPLLAARPSTPVIVAEGERKVHALERLGFTATCNAGGTGMGWLDGYSLSLVGRRVVVLPDNDQAGREHAQKVVGSLVRHGAAGVRLVELPGLAEKGDVVDWAAAGGRRRDLLELIRATPEWRCR